MAGAFRADRVVVGIAGGAAGIAGDDVVDALHMLEHGFHAPEAAAGEHGGFGARRGRWPGRRQTGRERQEARRFIGDLLLVAYTLPLNGGCIDQPLDARMARQ